MRYVRAPQNLFSTVADIYFWLLKDNTWRQAVDSNTKFHLNVMTIIIHLGKLRFMFIWKFQTAQGSKSSILFTHSLNLYMNLTQGIKPILGNQDIYLVRHHLEHLFRNGRQLFIKSVFLFNSFLLVGGFQIFGYSQHS